MHVKDVKPQLQLLTPSSPALKAWCATVAGDLHTTASEGLVVLGHSQHDEHKQLDRSAQNMT
jgi:hypothetical protein